MGKFYLPESIRVGNLRIIVYTHESITGLLPRTDRKPMQEHLGKLCSREEKLGIGLVGISLLWEDHGDLMTDFWLITGSRWSSSKLSTSGTFRRNKQGIFVRDERNGVSVQYGPSIIAREAEYYWFGGSKGEHPTLKEYLENRPTLHPETTNEKRFYQH